MTWTYTMTPVIPGLTIVPSGLDSRIAEIVGIPEQPYSGQVTIEATDGVQVLTQVITVEFVAVTATPIASLEFGISWGNQIRFAFEPIDIDALRLTLQFSFKELMLQRVNFTPTIVFTFEPTTPPPNNGS